MFYLDAKFKQQTHLLAIRPVRPDPAEDRKCTAKVVKKWSLQVLHQFGLKESDIAGAVTDSGTDVKAGLGEAFNWEWCVPHMLNRVTVDGAGTAIDKARSRNPLAREVVDDSRRVIEHFKKSDAAKVGLHFVVRDGGRWVVEHAEGHGRSPSI